MASEFVCSIFKLKNAYAIAHDSISMLWRLRVYMVRIKINSESGGLHQEVDIEKGNPCRRSEESIFDSFTKRWLLSLYAAFSS